MRGPQSHDAFEAGWSAELGRRMARYGGEGEAHAASSPRTAMMLQPEAGMVVGNKVPLDAGGAAGPMARPGVFMSDSERTFKDKIKDSTQELLARIRAATKGHTRAPAPAQSLED
jgi:hypothetical protein